MVFTDAVGATEEVGDGVDVVVPDDVGVMVRGVTDGAGVTLGVVDGYTDGTRPRYTRPR